MHFRLGSRPRPTGKKYEKLERNTIAFVHDETNAVFFCIILTYKSMRQIVGLYTLHSTFCQGYVTVKPNDKQMNLIYYITVTHPAKYERMTRATIINFIFTLMF